MPIQLSFVLPCYNVGRYIADCLDSIFSQDIDESLYEVICVDDCSTDNTKDIIVSYSMLHTNLKLIEHKENLTAGGARNTGIDIVKGDYIWFVDPDDMIKGNICTCLLESLSLMNPDIFMFNNDAIDEYENEVNSEQVFKDSECVTGKQFVEKYFPHRLYALCIVWRCIFRRNFLLEHSLRYPRMRKSEDVVFLWNALLCAERVVSLSDSYYVYRCNPHSVGKKTLQAKVAFSERILFGFEISKMLQNDNLSPMIIEDMHKTLSWCANGNMELLSKMSRAELIIYHDEIKRNIEAVRTVRQYMNRKWRWLYSSNWTCGIWLVKVSLLSFYAALKK